jgi:hypothetical protein
VAGFPLRGTEPADHGRVVALRPVRGWALGLLLACLILGAGAGQAVAGPVILGGDDLTQHGQVNSAGEPQLGWLYIQRALANISPNVTRPNDNSVAALGSSPAAPTESGDAGAGIGVAAPRAGLGVNYYDGAPAINDFFAKLRAGQLRPRIIWLSGTEATNDLGSCSGTENEAVAKNAALIDDFVSNGGGLMSHGTCYTWVTSLLPGLQTVDSGSSDDLYFTPEGLAAFPGLTLEDINAGPWHNHFQGNFGGLQVLVRSRNVKETAPSPTTPPTATSSAPGDDAAVVLGGSAVAIRPPPPPTCVNPTVVRDRKVSLPGGGNATLLTRQFSDAATPFRVSVRRTRQFITGVTYLLNGRAIAANVPAARQVPVPAAGLKPGRGRNLIVAQVTLATGRKVSIRQFFIIVRCSVPRVACKRLSATSLRCNTRTPLGVRRVRVTAASPAGGTASGTARVTRGRYTVTLRAKVSLPPGRYTYRHLGTTRRRGERMTMIRYVTVT